LIKFSASSKFRVMDIFRVRRKIFVNKSLSIFDQNFDFWPKFWSKFESFVKIWKFGQNSKFWKKQSKFWSKLQSLVKKFGLNSKAWSKNSVKTRIFGQNSKFLSKIEILIKARNFGLNSKVWSKFKIFFKTFFSKVKILATKCACLIYYKFRSIIIIYYYNYFFIPIFWICNISLY